MRLSVGQDALGRWAWMLTDEAGQLIESDEDFYEERQARKAGKERYRSLTAKARKASGAQLPSRVIA